jgi:small acid-soluble spore protein H (minor)
LKFKRAQEIMASSDIIEVSYHGIPVWIETVNPEDETVRIKADALPYKEKTVPVDELQEQKGDTPLNLEVRSQKSEVRDQRSE